MMKFEDLPEHVQHMIREDEAVAEAQEPPPEFLAELASLQAEAARLKAAELEDSRDPIDNADQPPEVDIHDPSKLLPPPDAAAHRVIEFLSWFGDGEIFNSGDPEQPPLYARDLSMLASLTLGRAA